jgi:signal transduction histidine kinase
VNRKRNRYPGWLLLALMAAVSSVLAVIQYNWTGRLGRAESERMRVGVREQLRQINRAWTAELTDAWRALRPSPEDMAHNRREAYATRYREWLTHENRPLFSAVGVVDEQELSGPDAGSDSLRFAMPGAQAREWMVFELNREYLTRTWLPELIRAWGLGSDAGFRVRVRTSGNSSRLIYDSQADATDGLAPLVSAEMFTVRDGRPHAGEAEHRWTIEAWNRNGSLEAAVAAARWRNFGIACLLIGLLLAAGCLLQRNTARARRLAEMQIQFVAGISHEMRTPLAVIRGAGQNLAAGVGRDPERVALYARMLVKHADQLGETIEQVLTFAAAGQQCWHAGDTVSIAAAVNDALEAASVEVEASGCELRLDLASDLPQVSGDSAALRRAFQNLITNAARHGRSGGWIAVSAVPLELNGRQFVEVKVTDGGAGIPAAELPHIFEPFYRGERARAEQVRGAGLGLSLLHQIAKMHGGAVHVESVPGCGAEFRLRLPAISGIRYECANSAD